MTTPLKFAVASVAAICFLCVAIYLLKRKRLFAGLILSAMQGVCAIFAVKLAGMLIGVQLALNWYTIGASALLGTPGVISMLLARVIFKV